MFSAAIYFASSKDFSDKKCPTIRYQVSAVVYSNVDFENALVLEK